MRSVGAHQARTKFGALLREVENGASVIITRRGPPAAVLVPASRSREVLESDEVLGRTREFRKGNRLDGLSIRELIDEGRR